MANIILYTAIYFVLMLATALEIVLIGMPLTYALIIMSIVSLAGLKAVLIALYYQHLRYEPRNLSGPIILGLVAVFLFAGLSVLSLVGIR